MRGGKDFTELRLPFRMLAAVTQSQIQNGRHSHGSGRERFFQGRDGDRTTPRRRAAVMREGQRRRVLANRAAKQERRRRTRKGRRYRAWRHLTRDQQEVARRLTAGRIDLVTISGWALSAVSWRFWMN